MGRIMGFRPDDPSIRRDPYPAYRALRDEDPVHWSEDVGSWFLFRYDHVEGAIKDSRLSVARTRPTTGALEDTLRRFLVFLDPPQHTRIRALVNRAFTPRVAERMRPRIAAIVGRLLEPVVPTGRIDFIRDFAVPLPATVIAELLGARPEDLEIFKAWSTDFAAAMDGRMAPIDIRDRA
ncbi:MAG: hypothetical protein QOD06_3265, partial [Candidatus Binatota bacterium]|nr:hypothetical protein [Candidatus Binatota bacterium]